MDKPTELPGHDTADKVEAVGDPGAGKQQRANQSKRPGQKLEIPDVKQHDKLSLARGPRGEMIDQPGSQEVKGNSTRLKLQQGEGEAEAMHTFGNGGTRAHLNLSPSQSVLDRIAGAPANDHLEGIDEGEGTYLNITQRMEVRGLLQSREAVGGRALGSRYRDAAARSQRRHVRVARPADDFGRDARQGRRGLGPGGGEELGGGFPRDDEAMQAPSSAARSRSRTRRQRSWIRRWARSSSASGSSCR